MLLFFLVKEWKEESERLKSIFGIRWMLRERGIDEKNGIQIRSSPTNSLIEIFHQIPTSPHAVFKGVRKSLNVISKIQFSWCSWRGLIFIPFQMQNSIVPLFYITFPRRGNLHNQLCEAKALIKCLIVKFLKCAILRNRGVSKFKGNLQQSFINKTRIELKEPEVIKKKKKLVSISQNFIL